MWRKINKFCQTIRIRPIYLLLAILVAILGVVFYFNQDYILNDFVPDAITWIYNLVYFNIVDPLSKGQWQRVVVRLVLYLIGILVIVFIISSVRRDLSLWWFRITQKPTNTYEYGDLHWADYKEKRKELNRCRFENVNTQGVAVDVVHEIVFYFFGKPIMLRRKPLFVSKNKVTNQQIQTERTSSYEVMEEKLNEQI